MKKITYVAGLVIFVFCTCGLAKIHKSQHFIIDSDLDPRYVKIIQLNAEAYYENMTGHYFAKGWKKPLRIYYLEKQSDAQKLYNKHDHKGKIGYGRYTGSSVPAVYTHRLMDDGGFSGLGTLFHEITHHFVYLNYNRVPSWFNEGLATFSGEQTRIVKGKLTLGRPNPWREHVLRNMIEKGQRVNVKFLTSLTTTRKFQRWKPGYHITRAFFYWLHETELLDDYLKKVQQEGYGLSVLEETAGKSYRQINKELLTFIKTNCYAAAYYEDGRRAKGLEQKKKFFEKTLEIKPDYQPAILELARCFYKNKDYEKCRVLLKPMLDDSQSTKYRSILYLMASSYYVEKDYVKALEYYKKVWEYSDYNEYKHEVAYWIANCYRRSTNQENAELWYKKFLEENWEPKHRAKWVTYAQEYLQRK
jgi:tetratricopeptide (TPR) repeat protein